MTEQQMRDGMAKVPGLIERCAPSKLRDAVGILQAILAAMVAERKVK